MGKQNVGCLGFLFRLFPGAMPSDRGASAAVDMPTVMVSNRFVSEAEADFFRVLRAVVGDRGHILAQVSLRQLLYFPARSSPGRQRWLNKVAQKSVDFVVCDPNTLTPKVVIELDEPSHARPDRQTRDEDVDTILEAASMPVLRVLTSRTYDTRELEATLAPYLREAQAQSRETQRQRHPESR